MSLEIIAELAQGFEGNYEQARLLVQAAAAAGADAAKFQLVYADELATPDYQYYELFKSLEMEEGDWKKLVEYADEVGIKLYVDIFGSKSLNIAEKIGVQVVKLHGTDIANIGLLDQVALSYVPKILLGAGGAYAGELNKAIEILSTKGKEVVVLLGFQGYPTPNNTNQIARVDLLSRKLAVINEKIIIGFADHADPESPLCYALAATAIGAGARVIEKHLTLGKNMKLEDHEAALNSDEFATFCEIMHGCMNAYGESNHTEDYGMSKAEHGYRKMIRRHVVVNRNVVSGTQLSPADLVLKRTSEENSIHSLELVYGQVVQRDLKENSPLTLSDID